MTLNISPLQTQQPSFVAEASGIDLRQRLAASTIAEIDVAMDQYAVLVFRDQPLDQGQQIAFSRQFGPLDAGLRKATGAATRFQHEELIDIGNVALDGSVAAPDNKKLIGVLANQLWHSDSSFMNPRAAYSMLHAVITPSWGGNTEFADLRAAHDALDARTLADIQGQSAEHFALHTRLLLGDDAYTDAQKQEIPPAVWPLVDTHAGSGRKVLFVGVHARHIVGWPVAESRMLLLDLLEHATQRQFVYTHEWQPGDLVIWDNRSTLHRGRRYDIAERRELRRTTINDTPEAMLLAA